MTIPFGKMFPYLNPQVSLQIVENPASLPRQLPVSLNRFRLTLGLLVLPVFLFCLFMACSFLNPQTNPQLLRSFNKRLQVLLCGKHCARS